MDFVRKFVDTLYRSVVTLLGELVFILSMVVGHPVSGPVYLSSRARHQRMQTGAFLFAFLATIVFLASITSEVWDSNAFRQMLIDGKPGRGVLSILLSSLFLVVIFATVLRLLQVIAEFWAERRLIGDRFRNRAVIREALRDRRLPRSFLHGMRFAIYRRRRDAALYAAGLGILGVTLFYVLAFAMIEYVLAASWYLREHAGWITETRLIIPVPFSGRWISFSLFDLAVVTLASPLVILPFFGCGRIVFFPARLYGRLHAFAVPYLLAMSTALFSLFYLATVGAISFNEWLTTGDAAKAKVTTFLCDVDERGIVSAYLVIDNRSGKDLILRSDELEISVMRREPDGATGFLRAAEIVDGAAGEGRPMHVIPSTQQGWIKIVAMEPPTAEHRETFTDAFDNDVYCQIDVEGGLWPDTTITQSSAGWQGVFDAEGAVINWRRLLP